MEIKRTTKTDVAIKTARIEDNLLIDENGEEINIVEIAKSLYGDGEFKLTLTRSVSEELEIDDFKSDEE